MTRSRSSSRRRARRSPSDRPAGALCPRVARGSARRAGSSSTTSRPTRGGSRASMRLAHARAGGGNLALLAASVSRFAELEDDVIVAFRNGGGVPWSQHGPCQEWQSEFSATGVTSATSGRSLGLAPGLTDRLHRGHRRADVGCGRGHAALRLAAAYPASRILGVDQARRCDRPGADRGERARAPQRPLRRPRRVRSSSRASYDAVLALDVIHDLAHPYETLRAILTRCVRAESF